MPAIHHPPNAFSSLYRRLKIDIFAANAVIDDERPIVGQSQSGFQFI